MQSLASARAIRDCGLEGDRYSDASIRKEPDYHLTLIELENIEAFTSATGLALSPDAPRRNIVTTQVRLNTLVGCVFRVGEAVAEGIELCEPCGLFKRRTHAEILRFFAGKGGLRARILSGGQISVGDPILTDA